MACVTSKLDIPRSRRELATSTYLGQTLGLCKVEVNTKAWFAPVFSRPRAEAQNRFQAACFAAGSPLCRATENSSRRIPKRREHRMPATQGATARPGK